MRSGRAAIFSVLACDDQSVSTTRGIEDRLMETKYIILAGPGDKTHFTPHRIP
jgi:hypothetical protein